MDIRGKDWLLRGHVTPVIVKQESLLRKSGEELHGDLSDDVILLQVSQLTGVVNPIIYLYSTKKTTSSVNTQSAACAKEDITTTRSVQTQSNNV